MIKKLLLFSYLYTLKICLSYGINSSSAAINAMPNHKHRTPKIYQLKHGLHTIHTKHQHKHQHKNLHSNLNHNLKHNIKIKHLNHLSNKQQVINHNHLHHHKFMTGIASFYGENDGFNGKLMANGRVFNTNNVHLAAHPFLPLGTKLMVTNLANQRSIYVEITDRIPYYKTHRIIDLSVVAAKYLGMYQRGITLVKLTPVSEKEFLAKKNYLLVEDDS